MNLNIQIVTLVTDVVGALRLLKRLQLPRGLPYAISALLHYSILIAEFFVAAAPLGLDMTKFTILAGAFTVGVGFGLQNIINNFASGLILLFERPMRLESFSALGFVPSFCGPQTVLK